MQYSIALLDVGFTYQDPLMVGGLIYSCLWLIVSMTLFAAFAQVRRGAGCPYSLARIVSTIVVYGSVGITLPDIVIVTLLNLRAGRGFAVGMPFGSPPYWMPAAAIGFGIACGLALARWQKTERFFSGSILKPAQTVSGGAARTLVAIASTLILPGMVQNYREQFIFGLLLLIVLSTIPFMFGAIALAAAFLILMAATLRWRTLRLW